MLLSRETNLRLNVIEWLVDNLSMTIEEAVKIMSRHHFNAESVQRSFGIPEQVMTNLMV